MWKKKFAPENCGGGGAGAPLPPFIYGPVRACLFCKSCSSFFRSSYQSCSIKKGALRNFVKFTGKQLRQSRFFNKVAGLQLY